MQISLQRARALPWVLAVGAILFVLAGCGGVLDGKNADTKPLAGTRDQQAAALLAQIRDYDSLGQWGQVVRTTGALLGYHRDDPRCATALALAIPAAMKLGDPATSLGWARLYEGSFAADSLLSPTFLKTRDLALGQRDTLTAAAFQVLLWRQDPMLVLGDSDLIGPVPLLSGLNRAQLGQLEIRLAPLPVEGLLGFHRVRRLMLAGRVDQARIVATALVAATPGDPWAAASADLVAGRRTLAAPADRQAATVVGLLVPLTGRNAGFGNAMDEAARLALTHAREAGGPELTLEELDTGGDPVQAVQAARTFCARPQVGVLVGALASGPTVAAALVASAAGVPLVSPTASNERIESLGEGIFQTNMNDQRDIRNLADLAVVVLGKKRTAILGPDNPAGHSMGDIFRARVDSLGGEVVAEAYFPAAVTDFHAQILEVRRRMPEVVFVPASFEQMTLLGPQLDFHHLGSLVLGTSAWSSGQPSVQQAAAFEGVIYPDGQARFPSAWVDRFEASWEEDAYSGDQTAVARMTYLAVRRVAEAMAGDTAPNRAEIARALAEYLQASTVEEMGDGDVAALTRGLRLVRNGTRETFPAGLFRAAFAAASDSSGTRFLSPDSDSTANRSLESR